jgi:hypothetical protein
MSHQLLIVCTYTEGSPYEAEARQLAESAVRFGYTVRGIAVPDQGDWWRNVGIKPSYVLEMLESHHGPLLFLDADCLILEPLDELVALLNEGDLAVKYRPGNCLSALFNAAVLLARRTPATLTAVKTWAERGRDFAHLHRFSEQGAFAEGIIAAQAQLRFVPLPDRFHMFPVKGVGGPPPGCVILHNKTSNRVRSTALPKAPPMQVCRLAADAHVVCIGPAPAGQVVGLPMSGIAAAKEDFTEYASRFGITKYWSIGLPVAAGDARRIEQGKVLALRKMFAQFPLGARIILADHDVVFLRNPQRIADAVQSADLALCWDESAGEAVPRVETIGIKLTETFRDKFLIDLERTHARLLSNSVAGTALPLALREVLGRLEPEVHVASLPSRLVADLSQAGPETVALSVRGQLSCIPGDVPCPTLLSPAATSPAALHT